MAINKNAKYMSSLHVTEPRFRVDINQYKGRDVGTSNSKQCSQSAICLAAIFSELLQELYGY